MACYTVFAVLLSVLFFSCAHRTYPLGHVVHSAYKDNLKKMRAPYRHFTPVQFPADSLAASQWTAPSPNFDVRTPVLVIIHQTEENSCAQSLHTLTNPNTSRRVSANYLVCRDGSVYKLVDEHYRAWQAGVSRWGNFHNINSISLGIELDNTGTEPFTGKQIASLLVILKSIRSRYHIPQGNFIAHADVAPTRRKDPGIWFPWEILAAQGFGYWRDSILPPAPDRFDYKTGLRMIGYDIRDTTAAIVAFKRHYVQTDISPELTDYDTRVLYDIFVKYDR